MSKEHLRTAAFVVLVLFALFAVPIGESLDIDVRLPVLAIVIGVLIFALRFLPTLLQKLRSVVGEVKKPPNHH